MILFAKNINEWFNNSVKNETSSLKDQTIDRYKADHNQPNQNKSTDINILLNRVRISKNIESKKKVYFSVAASAGILLFGFIIF